MVALSSLVSIDKEVLALGLQVLITSGTGGREVWEWEWESGTGGGEAWEWDCEGGIGGGEAWEWD